MEDVSPLPSAWPVLSKQELRAGPRQFVSEDAWSERLRLEQTSGTSGTPLQLWQTREASREWYALMEARWRGWYGVSRKDRWAILGGQLVAPVQQKAPPFWVWNRGLNQLYMSSYHLGRQNLRRLFEGDARTAGCIRVGLCVVSLLAGAVRRGAGTRCPWAEGGYQQCGTPLRAPAGTDRHGYFAARCATPTA